MRILLTGKNGQLGWELHRLLEQGFEVIAIGRDDVDFRNPDELHDMLRRLPSFSIIVNTAAYTKVDQAEKEQHEAELVNIEAPAVLACEADRRGIPMIHFSTDYVFDGKKWTKPYTEKDKPNPLSIYGKSKLGGELRVRDLCEKHLIFRVSGLYGTRRRNFLTTMLNYAKASERPLVVDDQIVSPNWTPLIAEVIEHVIYRIFSSFPVHWGVYHLTGNGAATWYEFAKLTLEKASSISNKQIIQPVSVSSEEFHTTAKRPAYSVMNSDKFRNEFGYSLPDWKTQLLHCINTIGKDEL
ncbi:MAG: dTDP-4-dehydrorhamnose reductase [Planctomycetaceae bacterium]|nr:dTDP-4-dehydrorhamnose reductase [Planctomycetaceae bacterium]